MMVDLRESAVVILAYLDRMAAAYLPSNPKSKVLYEVLDVGFCTSWEYKHV